MIPTMIQTRARSMIAATPGDPLSAIAVTGRATSMDPKASMMVCRPERSARSARAMHRSARLIRLARRRWCLHPACRSSWVRMRLSTSAEQERRAAGDAGGAGEDVAGMRLGGQVGGREALPGGGDVQGAQVRAAERGRADLADRQLHDRVEAAVRSVAAQ